jgi:hypothetical protein
MLRSVKTRQLKSAGPAGHLSFKSGFASRGSAWDAAWRVAFFWATRHGVVLPEEHGMKQHTTETIGNFDMGKWFGDVRCRHGHPTRLFKIFRSHHVACNACKA